MNHTVASTREVVSGLIDELGTVTAIDIIVCPPFTALSAAVEAAGGSNIAVGAQNVHWADSGAFTGEISADMLADIPVQYAIIGHSERRQYFGETDETVSHRLRAAIDSHLRPIVCVGESLDRRQAGHTETVVAGQIENGLNGISADEMRTVTVAYEPVWAIGTGETATPQQAQAVHRFIRGRLGRRFSGEIAAGVRIQYGGSVKAENAANLMAQPDIDGALVGGASLKVDEFSALVRNCL